MKTDKYITNIKTEKLCNHCHKTISGDYSIIEYVNNNVVQYTEYFHEECCENDDEIVKELWTKHKIGDVEFERIKREKSEQEKLKIIQLIQNTDCDQISFYENDGEITISIW